MLDTRKVSLDPVPTVSRAGLPSAGREPEPPDAGGRRSRRGERGISVTNPPLVALALAVVFLVALLAAVHVVGDPAAAYDLATRRLT
jgi:hypothetical protein